MRTSPEVGTRIPLSSFTVVDLPAPLGPTYATASPASIDRSTWSTAVLSTNRRTKRCLTAPRIPGSLSGLRKTLVSCRASTSAIAASLVFLRDSY